MQWSKDSRHKNLSHTYGVAVTTRSFIRITMIFRNDIFLVDKVQLKTYICIKLLFQTDSFFLFSRTREQGKYNSLYEKVMEKRESFTTGVENVVQATLENSINIRITRLNINSRFFSN